MTMAMSIATDQRRRSLFWRPGAGLVSHRRLGDASAFAVFSEFIGSFIGRVVLFVVTWALFHHLVGGFRHIFWDAGYGLDAPLRDQMAWATLIGGFALTVLVWIIGLAVR